MPTDSFLKQLFAGETLYQCVTDSSSVTPKLLVTAPIANFASSPKQEQLPIQQVVIPPQSTFVSLGYQQKVLILVSEPKAKTLNEADAGFLEKILSAVNLDMAKVDFINIDALDKQTDFKDMLSSKTVHHFITFGVPLKRLKLEILLVPYQIKPVEGINFLFADPLSTLQSDISKKKALWLCLKKMFSV